jgi:DNA polymerase-3 subunit delta
MTFAEIIQEVQAQKFAPVYYFHGEETWFLDKLSAAVERNALSESETAFNKEVFYGAEAQAHQVLNACQSFPMMAARRLVMVKEAQKMGKPELEKLKGYLQKPVPTTVLVLVFKGKNAGLPKAAAQGAAQNGIAYQAKKMYERDVRKWTADHIKASGFTTESGIPDILVDNLGLNIHLIENELEKMFIHLRAEKSEKLGRDLVFETINIDKEFNIFELRSAISARNVQRAHLIMDRLTRNTKTNPSILTLGNLFRFFENLMTVFALKLADPNAIKEKLGVNWYEAQDYKAARDRYHKGKVKQILSDLMEADLMLKGMIPTLMDERHIMKTLVWKILS